MQSSIHSCSLLASSGAKWQSRACSQTFVQCTRASSSIVRSVHPQIAAPTKSDTTAQRYVEASTMGLYHHRGLTDADVLGETVSSRTFYNAVARLSPATLSSARSRRQRTIHRGEPPPPRSVPALLPAGCQYCDMMRRNAPQSPSQNAPKLENPAGWREEGVSERGP